MAVPPQSPAPAINQPRAINNNGLGVAVLLPTFTENFYICTNCGAQSCGGLYGCLCTKCNGIISDPPRGIRHSFLCTQCARRRHVCKCDQASPVKEPVRLGPLYREPPTHCCCACCKCCTYSCSCTYCGFLCECLSSPCKDYEPCCYCTRIFCTTNRCFWSWCPCSCERP